MLKGIKIKGIFYEIESIATPEPFYQYIYLKTGTGFHHSFGTMLEYDKEFYWTKNKGEYLKKSEVKFVI